MASEQISHYTDLLVTTAGEVGLKILAAILFWFVGRWLIGLAAKAVRAGLGRQQLDPTVLRYVESIVTVTLNVLLVIGILGYFGIQTTTFAALIAGAGIAIGAAWAGLLANFAAGAFLIVLRPFKVGDFVTVAGVSGTVTEIGLFATTLNAADNIRTIVGNNRIFGDTIQNFTENSYRRIDLRCQLASSADHQAAIALLREKIAAVPNVLGDPPVDIGILEFTLVGPVLAVRPYCHSNHYWQVYFGCNQVIREALSEAGFPTPLPAHSVHLNQAV